MKSIFMKYFVILLLFVTSCALQTRKVVPISKKAPKSVYLSGAPERPVSPHLEKIVPAVKLISSLTFYRAWQFMLNDSITREKLSQINLDAVAVKSYIYERPSSGTAVALFSQGKRMVYLTVNHVVNHPDTVYSFYPAENRPHEASPYIQSFAVKIRQSTNIVSGPRSSMPVTLNFDREKDLALVGIKLLDGAPTSARLLNVPFGKAAELHWGTFVYLLGFPQGRLILNQSLVSEPNRDADHGFLLSALVSRGISGGIILAIRDSVPNFELVGIATALGAQSQYYLKPDIQSNDPFINMRKPYEGKLYIGQRIGNNSGIVYAISAEAIVNFIRKSVPALRDFGIDITPHLPSVSTQRDSVK